MEKLRFVPIKGLNPGLEVGDWRRSSSYSQKIKPGVGGWKLEVVGWRKPEKIADETDTGSRVDIVKVKD